MKIFVDELPKSCEECLMCRSGKLKLQRKGRYVEAEQCVFGQYKYQTIDDEIDTCPLQSLTDYTKQVRKEVVQEIKKFLNRQDEIVKTIYYNSYQTSGLKVIEETIELLDQIQGETK